MPENNVKLASQPASSNKSIQLFQIIIKYKMLNRKSIIPSSKLRDLDTIFHEINWPNITNFSKETTRQQVCMKI